MCVDISEPFPLKMPISLWQINHVTDNFKKHLIILLMANIFIKMLIIFSIQIHCWSQYLAVTNSPVLKFKQSYENKFSEQLHKIIYTKGHKNKCIPALNEIEYFHTTSIVLKIWTMDSNDLFTIGMISYHLLVGLLYSFTFMKHFRTLKSFINLYLIHWES